MNYSRDFILHIPKSDLHLHLDGSIRISTLIDLAKEHNVTLPAYTEEELKKLVFKDQYQNLDEYLQGFAYMTAVLQTESALERVAYELVQDNIAEGVRYIEVRFAPQLHQHSNLDIMNVFLAVNRGLKKAKEEFNSSQRVQNDLEPPFEYGIIACAMRMFDFGFSEFFDRLLEVHHHSERKWIFSLASQELVRAAVKARNEYKIPIVGFDLAGREKGYPAEDHREAYSLAHRNFLKKTVHAGEAFGPESIFQAITELHADRLGHAMHLFNTSMIEDKRISNPRDYVNNLVQYIGDRRITIEVCLTSNMQTNPEIRELKDHSFGSMLKNRLSATFCTDNRTVSSTTVTDEILKAIDAFDIPPKLLKDLIIHGFKRGFFPGTYVEKRRYVRQIIDYFNRVLRRFDS